MEKSVFYEELTSTQLKLLCDQNRVVLFSFGSVEQHSSHLPVGTDYLCSLHRVESIAKKTDSIVFAPFLVGYSFNHKDMFSTISLSPEVMLQATCDVFKQFCKQGWKRFLIFSGHAGNWAILELAVQVAREDYPFAQFILAKGLPNLGVQHNINRFLQNFDYHAGRVETALVAHFCPQYLDAERIPYGNDSLPELVQRHIKNGINDIYDELLLKAYTPQKTSIISSNGIWGTQDPHEYKDVPVKEAMDKYEDFFVNLISRWNDWETKR